MNFKRLLAAILAPALLSTCALAESFTGADGWAVRFLPGETMESTFKSSSLTEALSHLEPGDDVTFTITLQNRHETEVDWYMTNKVLYSLEDRSENKATNGGAYTYHLTYTNAAGEERILFSSDTVGGEIISAAGEGLHEATDALEDFFYLDSQTTGQQGTIRLRVSLDGETQGNDYQDTLADLAMNFAVELKTPGAEVPRIVVQTGDLLKMGPMYLVMMVSGVLFLLLALDSVRRRRREKARRSR